MRGTLSQTRNSTFQPEQGRARRAAARTGLASIATALALLLALPFALAGCYAPRDELNGDDARVEKIEAREGERATPWAWPVDPSHPVIALSIEGAGLSGEVLIELMPELAPSSVVAVAELARDGYYDGTTFHRVIPGFMIQGGDPNTRDRDPTNDGMGRPGRALPDEFSDAPFLRGVVGMGNKGRQNSASTQFFIMQSDKTNLDGRYNAIGRVIHGMDLVDQIAAVTTDRTGRWGPKDRPIENVVITQARPVGQVAAIRQALELEATQGDDDGTGLAAGAAGGLALPSTPRAANADAPSAPAAPAGTN